MFTEMWKGGDAGEWRREGKGLGRGLERNEGRRRGVERGEWSKDGRESPKREG